MATVCEKCTRTIPDNLLACEACVKGEPNNSKNDLRQQYIAFQCGSCIQQWMVCLPYPMLSDAYSKLLKAVLCPTCGSRRVGMSEARPLDEQIERDKQEQREKMEAIAKEVLDAAAKEALEAAALKALDNATPWDTPGVKLDFTGSCCLHCGFHSWTQNMADKEKCLQEIKDHDAVCEKHPMMLRIRELEAQLAKGVA